MNQFDFEQDLKMEIHSMFTDYGVKIPIRTKIDVMLLDYLTILKKLVIPKTREVLYSPVLKNKLDSHLKKNEIIQLENLFSKGKNINYYQSEKLFQTKFHDHLLYEWNIYHFHLGTVLEKKSKFFKQTDQMLFVYITDEFAVFLDVENHQNGIFGDIKWLEILHDYFPKLIEKYIDNSIIDVSPTINSIERQTLWNKGYTLGMTKVRDKIYHSPGIGRATSGHSILVTKTVSEILRWLYKINEQFKTKLFQICETFNVHKNETEFKLVFGRKTLEIIDNKSKTILLTYPEIFTF